MNKTIGFIGAGNMARAIIGGIVSAGLVPPSRIVASNHTQPKLTALQEQYGIRGTLDNKEAARCADILFLAVKPIFLSEVLEEIREEIRKECVVVSIVAAWTIERLEREIGKPVKIVRVMPNTPAMVGEAMSGMTMNQYIAAPEYQEEAQEIWQIFNSFGKGEWIPERLMDAVTGVSGSSPAFIFQLIEAMADAAVLEGMPRAQSYTFAAQAVLGAAKMVLETGIHPGALKDMVTSPGGTTIEGVRTLEEKGFRSAVIEAVHAASEKSRTM